MTLKDASTPALDQEEKLKEEGEREQGEGGERRRERIISRQRRIGPGRGQEEAREAEALQTGMRHSVSQVIQVFGSGFVLTTKYFLLIIVLNL